jgi:hypothetical protein
MSSWRILGLLWPLKAFALIDGKVDSTIGFVALKNLPIDTKIDFLALLVIKIELM